MSLGTWCAIECLNFEGVSWIAIEKVAAVIGCLPEDVCPPALFKQNCGLKRVAYAELPPDRLLPLGKEAMMLPAPKPDEAVDFANLEDSLTKILKTLTHREREVLKLRNGLGGDEPRSLRDVGAIFRIGPERVRQIEAKAIRKLQHPVRIKKLRSMMGDNVGPVLRIEDIDETVG